MLYDRRDFGLLRLAGAYQWLPLAPLRSLSPLKGLYHTALTAEESAYAEAHHGMVYSYLSKNKLPFDEFYDVAVFG